MARPLRLQVGCLSQRPKRPDTELSLLWGLSWRIEMMNASSAPRIYKPHTGGGRLYAGVTLVVLFLGILRYGTWILSTDGLISACVGLLIPAYLIFFGFRLW